jgi:hypothetical protein
VDFLKDLWGFMKERKKFWLLPIILSLLFFGASEKILAAADHSFPAFFRGLDCFHKRNGYCAFYLYAILIQ